MGRVLSIDYGTKRCGLAVTDEDQRIAFPLTTERTADLTDYLNRYLESNKVDRFIVGKPTRMNQEATHATAYVIKFVEKLKNIHPDIPVELVDERFTSSLAKHAIRESGVRKKERKNKELVDVTSATIILQSWLDSKLT